MAYEFHHNRKDAALIITKALPGTSASNTTDTIDLQAVAGDLKPDGIDVEISLPAMPLHVTAGNTVQIDLWVATTTSVAAPTSPLPVIRASQIGIVTVGTAAEIWRYKLPPNCPRYLGFRQTCGATDDLSSYTATYSLLS